MKEEAVFSIALFPPVEYFILASGASCCMIEDAEHFQKQSYRNRYTILTANGPQFLSVPVLHSATKIPIREVAIDYKTDWQRKHWRAIESSYNNSPFFLYYQDFILAFFEKKIDSLFEYNLQIFRIFLKLLNIRVNLSFTEEFKPEYPGKKDYRSIIHPKKAFLEDYPFPNHQPYSQVFDDRFGYVRNLSVLDLVFNLGNSAGDYINRYGAF